MAATLKHLATLGILLSLVAGCGKMAAPGGADKKSEPAAEATAKKQKLSLADTRRKFTTQLINNAQQSGEPAPQPPPNLFRLIKYPSPAGELSAYVTPDPADGAKHPAIVWITGGDCNSIGEMWEPAPRANDQSAAAYRLAGIAMMFPSLRGGNDNPSRREGFLGEVDDVIAAANYLAALPYVDAERVYLGGHSTGGTLVMLVAESSDRFRAAFAFGPVADVRDYGGQFIYHDLDNATEALVRSPAYWLQDVRSPLFAIEGTGGNIDSLRAIQKICTNPQIRFVEVSGVNHFNILAPANEAIAAKILVDSGPKMAITLTPQDLSGSGK